ncbi:DNA repair protein RadA [Trifolium pratense]|uniref:DNA repair protein RadA n=1 Tax=Trifolium pratense TaxID=57577 RepID=A0A2K3M441_TRIPR|nr:DNA repair protein RadA [Trifolium pratense]
MLSYTVSRFPSTQSLLTNATFPINPNKPHKFNFQQTASSSSDNNKAEDFLRENASNRVNPVDAVNDGVLFGRKKKMGKEKVSWVCSNCGYTAGQWWGVCRSCSVSGTMKEFHEVKGSESIGKVSGFSVMEDGLRSWLPEKSGELHPIRLSEVNRGVDHLHWRIPLLRVLWQRGFRVQGLRFKSLGCHFLCWASPYSEFNWAPLLVDSGIGSFGLVGHWIVC